jgi:hypothetical protein
MMFSVSASLVERQTGVRQPPAAVAVDSDAKHLLVSVGSLALDGRQPAIATREQLRMSHIF